VRFVLSAIAAKQKIWLAWGVGGAVFALVFLVLLMPFLVMRMRPFAVAVDGSKCLRTFSIVKCGKVFNCSFSMAAMSVCIGGQNKSWCMYFIACCLVGMVYALSALWSYVSGRWCRTGSRAVGLIGRCHNLVCGSRGPSNTVLPSIVTLHAFRVNVTSHPLSQNCRVASSDVCVNFGTMWAAVILSGSQGMSRLHVWVDMILLPSGRVILMGLTAIRLLVTGASFCMKWPVAPESEIPIVIVVGG
jgi:hypothetical protein